MVRTAPSLVWIMLILFGFPVLGSAQVGGTFVLVGHEEAGQIFDPANGSVVRFVTAISAAQVIYEERDFFGQPSGLLRGTASLELAPPTVTSHSSGPILFASDGVAPFSDPSVYHPTIFDLDDGSTLTGLYCVSDAPTGTIEWFTSIGGSLWVHAGTPAHLLATGGGGVIDVLRIEAGTHADGEAVVVYYHTASGAVRAVVSDSSATGGAKYFVFDPSSDIEILPATAIAGGFAATGAVQAFPSGEVGFFFVPQDGSYIGFAESTDPLAGWAVTRGSADPLLSTSANLANPDPARAEILELSLFGTPEGVRGYYVGAIPGLQSFSRSLGSVTFENPQAMDAGAPFIRGDANDNGAFDLVDVVFVLQYLFAGGAHPGCHDAADENDDGLMNLLDPIHQIEYFFAGGPPPPMPFAICAKDPTIDSLLCVTFTSAGCAP